MHLPYIDFGPLADFLDSATFKFFVLPLGTCLATVFVRAASRNDTHSQRFFRKEDFAIGLELNLIATFAFVTYCIAAARTLSTTGLDKPTADLLRQKLESAPMVILMLAIVLWGISTIVRRVGWKSEQQLTWFWGVLFPLFAGLLSLPTVLQ